MMGRKSFRANKINQKGWGPKKCKGSVPLHARHAPPLLRSGPGHTSRCACAERCGLQSRCVRSERSVAALRGGPEREMERKLDTDGRSAEEGWVGSLEAPLRTPTGHKIGRLACMVCHITPPARPAPAGTVQAVLGQSPGSVPTMVTIGVYPDHMCPQPRTHPGTCGLRSAPHRYQPPRRFGATRRARWALPLV